MSDGIYSGGVRQCLPLLPSQWCQVDITGDYAVYLTVCSSKWRKHQSYTLLAWWRHQMETFSALLALCAGSSPVSGEFPAQRPVTRSFDVFFDLHLNKRLSKQSWGWWSETPSRPLWRHCNGPLWRVPIGDPTPVTRLWASNVMWKAFPCLMTSSSHIWEDIINIWNVLKYKYRHEKASYFCPDLFRFTNNIQTYEDNNK